jgi:hypothetical protein
LRGEEQRRDVGADLRQRAQQREPVHTRHHQVGDDDGRPEEVTFSSASSPSHAESAMKPSS